MRMLAIAAAVALALPLAARAADGPTRIRAKGDYTHPGTKMVFPQKVGALGRAGITEFMPPEKDVSVGYNLDDPQNPVIVTVYVYPAPSVRPADAPPDAIEAVRAKLFQEHLDGVLDAVKESHKDAKQISSDEFTLDETNGSHKGRRVVFELTFNFGAGPQEALSHVYLFQTGDWFVKYRVSFQKAAKAEAEKAIAEFMKALAWPKASKAPE